MGLISRVSSRTYRQRPNFLNSSNLEPRTKPPRTLIKMDQQDAFKNVLKEALSQRKLARGLNECARALDSRNAVLCVLATNCNEDNYKKLIEALCAEHQIQLVKVDEEGEPRKVVKCSVAVITQWGPESEAQKVVRS